MMGTPQSKRGILVIDDDPQFGSLLSALARARGIPLEYYTSLSELGSFALLGQFDAAILDYYLESMNGMEIAEYVETFFDHLPVILVSGTAFLEADKKEWPKCVRQFVPKARGPYAILDSAVAVMPH